MKQISAKDRAIKFLQTLQKKINDAKKPMEPEVTIKQP